MLCKCFWDAGISKDALIFLPSKGSDISKYLLVDEAVKFSILTGGEDTAYAMLKANPTLLLSAETGGKNATIVSKLQIVTARLKILSILLLATAVKNARLLLCLF